MDGSGSSAATPPSAAAASSSSTTTTPVFSEPKLLDGFEEGNKSLDKLKELGIEGALFEHHKAMTVPEQELALRGVTGDKTKNLFLKV